jgi:hypothetical protein
MRRKQISHFFVLLIELVEFSPGFRLEKREKDIIIIFWQSSSVKVLENLEKLGFSKAQPCPFGKAP